MAQEIMKPQVLAARTATSVMTPPAKNVFEQYAEAVSRNRIIGELLKFSKGEWLSGRDGDPVEAGTELIAACDRLEVGWVRWSDAKPVEFRMGFVADEFHPAMRNELPDLDPEEWERDEVTGLPRDPWQLSNSMILMDPETSQLFTFASSSKGAIGALGKLMGSYGKHWRSHPDDLPLVALQSDSYKHSNKQFGRIHFPVFKVTGWTSGAAVAAALAADQEALAAEAEAEEEVVQRPAAAAPKSIHEKSTIKPAPAKAPAGKPNAYAQAKVGVEPRRGPGRPRKEVDVPF